jgi:hypothetical protein
MLEKSIINGEEVSGISTKTLYEKLYFEDYESEDSMNAMIFENTNVHYEDNPDKFNQDAFVSNGQLFLLPDNIEVVLGFKDELSIEKLKDLNANN